MGSHEVVGKSSIITETFHLTSIGGIFSSTHDTKQLYQCMAKFTSQLCGDFSSVSCPCTCQQEMEPFRGHSNTHGCLTNIGNKPLQELLLIIFITYHLYL